MGYNLNAGEIERRAALISSATKLPRKSSLAIAEKLLRSKTATFDDMLKALDGDWDQAGRTCGRMESAGLLSPMKNAYPIRGADGGAVSRYRICFPTTDASASRDLDESVTRGNPSLFTDCPWMYAEHADELAALSKWVRSTYGRDVDAVSEGERAYEIWGDEKKLLKSSAHKSGFRELLIRLRFDMSLLQTYSTSQGLFRSYLLPARGHVLVSENLDFYYSLKKLLRNGPLGLFGVTISGAMFGSGAAANSESFAEYLTAESIDEDRLLYVGDIDPSGIRIAQNFAKDHGDVLFYPLYEEMAHRHAMRRKRGGILFPYPEEQRGQIDEEGFLENLDQASAQEVARSLSEKIRIPQEIITLTAMKELANAK